MDLRGCSGRRVSLFCFFLGLFLLLFCEGGWGVGVFGVKLFFCVLGSYKNFIIYLEMKKNFNFVLSFIF